MVQKYKFHLRAIAMTLLIGNSSVENKPMNTFGFRYYIEFLMFKTRTHTESKASHYEVEHS